MPGDLNRRSFGLTAAPGTSGNFAVGAAVSAYSALDSSHNGTIPSVLALDPASNKYEVRRNCVYDHSTLTLTRGTIESTSEVANAAVNLGSGTIVTVVLSAGVLAPQLQPGVVFVHPSGDDSTAVVGDPSKPFATIAAAITGRGTALNFVCRGTFNLGGGFVVFPVGAEVDAFGSTWNFDGSLNVGSSKRACLEVAQGSGQTRIRGLTMNVAQSAIITCAPIGWNPSVANTGTYPDLVLEDCKVTAATDVLYAGGNSTGRIIARRCTLISAWDIAYSTNNTGGLQIRLEGCELIWKPRRDTNGLNATGWGQIRGLAELVIIGGSITYDTSVENTSTANSAWNGLMLSNGGQFLRKLTIGGGFQRYNVSVADETRPLIQGDSTSLSAAKSGIFINGGSGVDVCDYTIANTSNNLAPALVPLNYTHKQSFLLYGGTARINRNPGWKLSAAALTQTFALFTPGPGVMVTKVWLERRTAVAGVSTATAEVGIAGNTTKYMPASSVMTTGVSAVVTPNSVEWSADPYTTDGPAVILTVRSTGGNLSAVTDGVFIIHFELSGVSSDMGVPP